MTDDPSGYKPAFQRPGSPRGAVDDEFAFHIETRTNELIARGMAPDAARAEALRRFGDLNDARRYCERTDKRRMTRMLRMEYVREFAQDIAYAARSLRKAPAFTFFAVLTLALGIGANTSIFSVVRGILLRPMPFAAPEQLVTIWASYNGQRTVYHSPANIIDIKAQSTTLADVGVYTADAVVLTGAGDPERIRGADVTANFFPVLGVRAVAGRLAFSAGEDVPNGTPAVLIRESLWRTHFGADTGIFSRSITLDNTPYRVVGIVPDASAWPATAQFWEPLKLDPAKLPRGAVYVLGIGRLKPGATLQGASADVRRIAQRLAAQYPDMDKNFGADATDLRDAVTGSVEQPLIVLLAAVTLVLFIACANVANLLLVRGVSRQSDLALRAALGAGRGRLARQLITESLLLASVGGVLGVGLAYVATRALVRIAPPNIPRLDSIHLDPTVLGVALGVTVLTGLIFGLVPARQVARANVGATLREGGRGMRGGSASARTRTGLVVAEVALAVMLVVGAGLLVQSFRHLMAVDPGFNADNAATFSLSLPSAAYPDPARRSAFVDGLISRLRAVPGVRDVGAGISVPLTAFNFQFSFEVAEHPKVAEGDQPAAQTRVATPGYFTTLGIPVVKGRAFTDADRDGAQKVMLITEAAVQKFFPNEDPIGKHIVLGWGPNTGGEIVGVVRDVKQSSLADAVTPQFYLPFAQRPVESFSVVVRTTGPIAGVLHEARAVVKSIDPNLALAQVTTMRTVVDESVAQPRFYMTLLTAFAALALVLSAVGIYGVIAYVVGQRSREIGIRIALGASGANVLRMVMRQGIVMTCVGVAVGIGGALMLTKFMGRLLFEVAPTDVTTYGVTIVTLVGVAVLASLVPALRAAHEDPTVAMRAE